LLRESYKGIDVANELNKMKFWLLSPKGASRKGSINFIINWLNNALDSKPAQSVQNYEETPSSLRPYLDEYLKELWKGREHILEMNKRRS
jgi:hypothetical protein